jgi:type I restriction-modification system DNA methylase subunit
MSQLQADFFETETAFFNKITSISGLLKPSQSKDEKKAKIREKLIEYNQEIPACVYLPTNQTYRVVGIVTSSGMPM